MNYPVKISVIRVSDNSIQVRIDYLIGHVIGSYQIDNSSGDIVGNNWLIGDQQLINVEFGDSVLGSIYHHALISSVLLPKLPQFIQSWQKNLEINGCMI